ncbi:MAG: hypothetical protein RBR67_15150 [Desulfobacterium sp.]|nr:hypothetical protein [Desulfobacterium sp.]
MAACHSTRVGQTRPDNIKLKGEVPTPINLPPGESTGSHREGGGLQRLFYGFDT